MIDVVYKAECGVLSLSLDGHAGAAEFGQDIICAAASMLAYTLAAAVSDADKQGKLRGEPIIALSGGHARIVCVPFPDECDRMRSYYELIVRGYEMLCARYPDNVSLISASERV